MCLIYFQIKTILDEIVEKLPDEFNMVEVMGKVPPEERTPYVVVAFQECERMNGLTSEIKRTLKELDLGLKVCTIDVIIFMLVCMFVWKFKLGIHFK